MTEKELLKRAINFGNPGYVPHNIDVSLDFLREKDTAKQHYIRQLLDNSSKEIVYYWNVKYIHNEKKDNGIAKTDEWGTKWFESGNGLITTYHPMEEGYEYIDRVCFPNASLPGRFDDAKSGFESKPDKYHLGGVWFTLFERLWMLRGFENMLMDPYSMENEFLDLKEKIMQVNLEMIDKWLELGVDGVFFSDDWGTQRGMLINPDDWRRFYKKDYQRMFDRVRNAGKHVWMHLCGNVIDIIPDLIDIGLNVLNPVQPQAMDLEYLSREYRGHLCFNGGIDVQGVMVSGTPDEVRAAVQRTIHQLSTPDGGYICSTSHSIMPETPLDNVIALLESIAEYKRKTE